MIVGEVEGSRGRDSDRVRSSSERRMRKSSNVSSCTISVVAIECEDFDSGFVVLMIRREQVVDAVRGVNVNS